MAEYYFRAEVLRMLGITSTRLWELIRDGVFPAAFELGKSGGRRTKIGWLKEEVDGYFSSRPRRLPKGYTSSPDVEIAEIALDLISKLLEGSLTEEERAEYKALLKL